jgi:hypothetical protein
MNPDDVKAFEDLTALRQELNKELKFKTFPMEDLELAKRMTSLEKELASLSDKIDRIFGKSVLIKGRFVDISIPPK